MSKEVTYENPDEKFIKITSTGNIDFEITLSLTEQEAEIFQIFPDKIETISDCQEFLIPVIQDMQTMTFKTNQFKRPNIYDYVRLSSNNATINSLLVINRAFKKKAFIEFISMSELKFKPENLFLREVIKNISEQNFLFLVENNFLPHLESKIKFIIKIDNRIVKAFDNICENNTTQNESIIKKDNINDNNNIMENSLLFNMEKQDTQNAPKSGKSIRSKISGNNRSSNQNENLFNNNINLEGNNEYENKNQSNNSKINIRESSNLNFNNENEHLEGNINNENKSIRNNDNIELPQEFKQMEGDLNDLEKELADNKEIYNNENADKSNINNELDETANKILNSIPNAGNSEDKENLNNQSKISNNNNSKLISNNNININNEINISNQSNIVKKQIGEEDNFQIKDQIFSNVENIDENKENSKFDINNYNNLNNQVEENLINKEDQGAYDNQNKENENNNLNNEENNNANNENQVPEIEPLSVFERFKYDFSGTDYFFVDMNEMLELKRQNFQISDFYSLLKKITEDFKNITIIINFPNIINNIGFLDLESINILNEIISLTDIYIFDKKDALALFNLMAQINSEEDNYEDKKNLEQLFIKEVKKKRKSHPKIGIFLDEMKRVTIIEQQTSSNLILFHTDYEFNLIPANVSKVISEDYKKLFVVHYEMLKSVFIGGLFSRILYKKPFNSGFTAGNESLKRVIELLRFNLDPPLDPNFFLIRIKKNIKLPDEEEKLKKKKESHFVLDSTNVVNSKMREYNPLFDGNLVSYFSSKYIRNHLKKLGFINKKGSILQDPDNKKLGIIESKKLNKIYEEEKVNLEKIKDKKEKLKLQIKNLLQGNNVVKSGNMKEIEKLAKVYNFNPQSDKKLPKLNDFKKSINKNIKINSDMYYREIQKGKGSRSKSKHMSPKKNEANNNVASEKSKKGDNTLLDVIEKIEDKILYNDESAISGSKRNNNSINNIHNQSNISAAKDNNLSNLNKSNVNNISGMNNTENNLAKVKTKSGKSHLSQRSKLENSHMKNSSMNRNILDHALAAEMEEKSGENLISNNNEGNDNNNKSRILNENAEKSFNNDKENFDLKNDVEGEENNNNEPNKSVNKIENENNEADNKSIKENNLNDLSRISKKNDISNNDLNASAKKSNLISENNLPKDNMENEEKNIEELNNNNVEEGVNDANIDNNDQENKDPEN